jgi:hypothetical protein
VWQPSSGLHVQVTPPCFKDLFKQQYSADFTTRMYNMAHPCAAGANGWL